MIFPSLFSRLTIVDIIRDNFQKNKCDITMKKIISLFICFLLSNPFLKAQTIHWQGAPFFIYTHGISLGKLLKEIGLNYGIPVIVSPDITDTFSGELKDKTPNQMLDELSTQYNLTWYFDGDVIYFYKIQDIKKQILSSGDLPIKALIKYLKNSGLPNGKNCALKALTRLNTVEIIGVPVCIERATQLTSLLNTQRQNYNDNKQAVRVFSLKYASATDTTYQYRDQKVTLPGLVSVLRDMNSQNTIAIGENKTSGKDQSLGLPLFSADPRQNALIVRDRVVNMPIYASLVKQLDVRPIEIEISVAIIDVDASDINQLGINWEASASLGGGKVSFNKGFISSDDGGFSTVVGNDFMVRINALEQHSKARVLSRPSIVTLNNIQAVLDKNVTFYTKLQGDKVAKLDSRTTGTLMQVTPRMIKDKGKEDVLLNLDIQDGQQRPSINNTTEILPQIDNSQITTQAVLKPGQNLLLGGFIQDSQKASKHKIPLLGDIPLIGGLFRSSSKQSSSVVRLFLIKAVPVKNKRQ